ncbi:MAG: transporter [Nitrospinae bacterium CG11_big_fil_rev_8_21_14_0_20_45_15]|nr:MAG: transporter [Nitrospinae bacterium CG11_big_fil_rev_8_21_14_0_20_45_15]
MKCLLILWSFVSVLAMASFSPAFAEPDGTLHIENNSPNNISLQQASAKALLKNPILSAFSQEVQARSARTLQSSLLPNPTLSIQVGNAFGSGSFGGFRGAETNVQVGQLIELGGKRSARINVGKAAEELAGWDYDSKRLEVLMNVHKAFVNVLKMQHSVSLAEDMIELGNNFFEAVSQRVKAGKIASIEQIKAKVALSNFKIALEKTKQDLKQAKRQLSRTWGDANPGFEKVLGNLFKISPAPPIETLQPKILQTPSFKLWESAMKQRQAEVKRERSKRIPNITLSGGYRRLEQSDDNAVTFGLSIPLQFFNRNQGAIAEAQHNLSRIQEEKRSAEIEMTQTFLNAYQTLVLAHSRAQTLQTEILPSAQQVFDGVSEGYRFGKFGFLEFLDSQKTYFTAKQQYLESLANYHFAVADVESLIGEPLVFAEPKPMPNGEKPQQ